MRLKNISKGGSNSKKGSNEVASKSSSKSSVGGLLNVEHRPAPNDVEPVPSEKAIRKIATDSSPKMVPRTGSPGEHINRARVNSVDGLCPESEYAKVQNLRYGPYFGLTPKLGISKMTDCGTFFCLTRKPFRCRLRRR